MNDPEQVFTRADVAGILGLSVDFVRRNEKALGLDAGRVVVRRRDIRYRRWVVERLAAKLGIDPRDS